MKAEDRKFSLAAMMQYDLRQVNRAVSHSRHFTSHATQSVRSDAADKPIPSYIASGNKNGQNNTGRIWRF